MTDNNEARLRWCYEQQMSKLLTRVMSYDEWCELIDEEIEWARIKYEKEQITTARSGDEELPEDLG